MKITDIQRGDIFYECENGVNTMLMAVTTPAQIKETVHVWAKKMSTGQDIVLIQTPGLEYHGPRLYKEPQYVNKSSWKAEYD